MSTRFFFYGELVGSKLNWSLGVDGSICTFTPCDCQIGHGDMLVEHIDCRSFMNRSLVTTLGKGYLDCSVAIFLSSFP
jgi:hypothetical protein